jgi:hypothetical protein
MGRAEELFSRLRDRDKGTQEVQRMIEESVVEELFLDYKQSSTILPSRKLSEEDKKNLAKAIAGFANSEGGVIVWGVDCRQTENGDVPTRPVPITQPIALKTLFDGALGGLTLPAHSGVENVPLQNATSGEGFVITYVPAGFHVPYQTLYPKQEYYIRAGSNFLPTPHAVLAGLFGRAPQPYPAPVVSFGAVGAQTTGRVFMQLILKVNVINKGRGFAEDIFCVVDAKWPQSNRVRYAVNSMHVSNAPAGLRFIDDRRDYFTQMLGDDTKLPPGAQLCALHINIEIEKRELGDYAFTVSCGSRGGPGAAQTITITGDIVDEAFEHYTHQGYDPVTKKAGDDHCQKRIEQCLGIPS